MRIVDILIVVVILFVAGLVSALIIVSIVDTGNSEVCKIVEVGGEDKL